MTKLKYRIYRVKYCTYPFVVYLGNTRIRQVPSVAEGKSLYPTAVFKRSRVKLKRLIKAD